MVILWVYRQQLLVDVDETEIKEYQAAHDISKPLDLLTLGEQNAVFLHVSKQIKAAAFSSV